MPGRDRRTFLQAGAALGTTLFAAPVLGASQAANPGGGPTALSRLERRTLGSGQHRVDVSPFGLGCMGMSGLTEAVSKIRIVGDRYTGPQA